MPVLSLACHLPHNTPIIPSRYNNEQTTKQTKAINNSYIYIYISCKCDTNRAGHSTLDAYASRPVACTIYRGTSLFNDVFIYSICQRMLCFHGRWSVCLLANLHVDNIIERKYNKNAGYDTRNIWMKCVGAPDNNLAHGLFIFSQRPWLDCFTLLLARHLLGRGKHLAWRRFNSLSVSCYIPDSLNHTFKSNIHSSSNVMCVTIFWLFFPQMWWMSAVYRITVAGQSSRRLETCGTRHGEFCDNFTHLITTG